MLAAVGSAALGVEAHHELSLVKNRESLAFDAVGELDEFHSKADVGLIVAVAPHRLVVGHAGHFCELDAVHFTQYVAQQAFKRV